MPGMNRGSDQFYGEISQISYTNPAQYLKQHRRRGDNGSHTESGKKGVHRVSE